VAGPLPGPAEHRPALLNACGADPDAGLGEEHDPETHLIPLLLRAVRTGHPSRSFGEIRYPDGTCIRDYIHVRDLAEAHILALGALVAGGGSGAYNVGTGGDIRCGRCCAPWKKSPVRRRPL